MKPIESVQLGERTYQTLRDAIINVELAPGEALKDRELAKTLGVSRTPVREALYRLESEDLVASRGRSGWVVSEFREEDVRELFELRRLLEPVGLERLEKEQDPETVKRIATFFDAYEHPIVPANFPDYFRSDHAFHTLLVNCSQNKRLQSFYEVIESHIVRGRNYLSVGAEERVDETLDEHGAVARAVAEGDFARARDHLLTHLTVGEERMLEQLRLRTASSRG